MSRRAGSSELGRLFAPVVRVIDAAWRRMHWWIAAMILLYAASGVTVVQQDETAVVLRWGRLVGDTPALQEHGPGLLFAFPRPMDEVVRIKARHVDELEVSTLAAGTGYSAYTTTLDPLTVGYALTGDQNIVHADMMVRYQVREPAEWAFHGPRSEDILRVEVSAAMLRSLGEMGVDRVLSDGRKDLIATTTRRAQAGLDAAHSGLALVSLELTGISPPRLLIGDFDAVQSDFIAAETQRQEAQAYAEDVLPKARAWADTNLQSARANAASAMATARGAAAAFLALDAESRANPGVVRERLYLDGVTRAISGAQAVHWLPPPIAGRYDGLRLLLGLDGSSQGLTLFRAKPSPALSAPPESSEGPEDP